MGYLGYGWKMQGLGYYYLGCLHDYMMLVLLQGTAEEVQGFVI